MVHMAKPIGVQLYSVRDAIGAQGYESVIRKIASFGYPAVEPAGFPGTTPQAAAALFKELGLQAPSAHTPLPLGDKRDEVMNTMKTIGAKYVVLPFLPKEQFTTVADVKALCKPMNEANAVVRDAGMTLLYHNHWWEYQPVEGTYPYKVMAETLDPSIGFELDTYWAKTGGVDPVAAINELGDRVKLLHIKDGPATTDGDMVAVGEGVMNFPAILAAAKAAEWLIVELDRCGTDMLTAVQKSYQNLEKMA